jgi:hypothetical protein
MHAWNIFSYVWMPPPVGGPRTFQPTSVTPLMTTAIQDLLQQSTNRDIPCPHTDVFWSRSRTLQQDLSWTSLRDAVLYNATNAAILSSGCPQRHPAFWSTYETWYSTRFLPAWSRTPASEVLRTTMTTGDMLSHDYQWGTRLRLPSCSEWSSRSPPFCITSFGYEWSLLWMTGYSSQPIHQHPT